MAHKHAARKRLQSLGCLNVPMTWQLASPSVKSIVVGVGERRERKRQRVRERKREITLYVPVPHPFLLFCLL
jgi:hypothetical protein